MAADGGPSTWPSPEISPPARPNPAVSAAPAVSSRPADPPDPDAAPASPAAQARPLPPGTNAAAGGAPTRSLRLLTVSSLYPNPAQPTHGVFVETRLRHLVAAGDVTATVIAPVPWFPGRTPPRAAVPAEEQRHGLRVLHPRFVAPPGLGMISNPFTLERAARAAIGRLLAAGERFDAIDAHYLYPDGVAAVRLGSRFGLPVVMTARGSDTSQLPDHAIPRRLILDAIARADALIAVSAGLKSGLVALGAPEAKVTVLRNGVDLALFRPVADRHAARAELGLGDGPVLLSVGHLIPRKGHHLTIAALAALPGHTLLIAGDGPERSALLALADQAGVADRLRLLGPQPQARLPALYSAADVMVLASSREGWANVLLESMACGTPVVTTPAWGAREAVAAPEAGLVLDEGSATAIAAGVRQVLAAAPDAGATRRYAERFSWDATTEGQRALFRAVLAARAG